MVNNDSYSTNQNTPLTILGAGVLANDTDADNNSLTAVIVSNPSHAATFTLNSNGSFSYTPVTNYSGPDSFTYRASDGQNTSNNGHGNDHDQRYRHHTAGDNDYFQSVFIDQPNQRDFYVCVVGQWQHVWLQSRQWSIHHLQ